MVEDNNVSLGININKMEARDPNDTSRTSTELELFFDLVYVIAVSAAASGLHHNLSEHKVTEGLIEFALSFGVLWNAWSGFTWFASGYDPQDVPYRISVFFQMFGSLMIAANISQFFEQGLTWVGVGGYVIMRIALLSQWARVYFGLPEHRKVAGRHIIGLSFLQLMWVSWLFFPPEWEMTALVIFMILELAMPLWAHAGLFYSWNPAHIAERYGLLVIIVLGEGVVSSSSIVKDFFVQDRAPLDTIFILASAGVALSFALWWLYFNLPFAKMLQERRGRPRLMLFNYGHIGVFATIASFGSALGLVADSLAEHRLVHAPTQAYVMMVLSVILVCYLSLIALMRTFLCKLSQDNFKALIIALTVVGLSYTAVTLGLRLGVAIWLVVLAPVAMIITFSLDDKRHLRESR